MQLNRAFRSVLAGSLMAAVASAQARSAPPAPVTLEPVFAPPVVEPNPCFEFGCYARSVFDRDTLAATGAVYPGVYVFVRDGGADWSLQTVLVNPETSAPTDDQSFGTVVAVSDDELFASSPVLGKVYVFRRAGGVWTHAQTLETTASAMVLQRGTALVGNRVYERRRGQYLLAAELTRPDAGDGTFGATLALEGDTALVGAPPGGAGGVGAAYAFERQGLRWVFVQRFTPEGDVANTGFATALGAGRAWLAIGAPATPGTDPTRPGVVRLYVRRGCQWAERRAITNPIPYDGQNRSFGNALDVQADRLLVSGYTSYPFAAYVPLNYLFELDEGWTLTAILDAGAARAVQLSGGRALVDASGVRFGTLPAIFDLPPAARDTGHSPRFPSR